MTKRSNNFFGVAATLLTLAGSASCSSPPNLPGSPDKAVAAGRESREVMSSDRSAAHAVGAPRLQALMQQIASGTASWPQDLPAEPEAANPLDLERAFTDAATLAGTLAAAARQLPDAVADRPMNADDRAAFTDHAHALRRHAIELNRAARVHKVEQMQRALGRVNASCFSCHDQFRDVAGNLK